MDIFKNVHLFVTVAKAKSFRRAAETLQLPTSTVSRRIAELEHDLGLRLFNRTTRRVELTESGRRHFENCLRIVQDAELAHMELTNLQDKPMGVIRASLPVDFSMMFLSPLLANFSRLYPDIQFDLDLSPAHSDLFSGSIDLAIRMGPPKEQNLIARKIASFSVGMFASPAYLAAHPKPITPQDLTTHECLRMKDSPWTLKRLSSSNHVEVVAVTGKIGANNVGMLKQLALEGIGIVATASEFVTTEIQTGALIPVLPEWRLPDVHAYALTGTRLLPAKVRIFIDYLVKQMPEIPTV
jgi:hypothetical protein